MKKMDKNGFVLAEAIVVAVFILGIFTFIGANFFTLLAKYNKVINYDNPEEIYLINTLYDEVKLSDEPVANGLYTFNDSNGTSITCSNELGSNCSLFRDKYYKTLIFNYLKIKSIYIEKGTRINNCSNINIRGLREYCIYKKEDFKTSSNQIYLVQFTNNRFAYLEAKEWRK